LHNPYYAKHSLRFYYPLLLVASQGQALVSLSKFFAERRSSRKRLFQHRIEGGGVGERLKPAVLKNKPAIRYLAENAPNPFASRKIAPVSVFWICSI
jgi:hypothetical protein